MVGGSTSSVGHDETQQLTISTVLFLLPDTDITMMMCDYINTKGMQIHVAIRTEQMTPAHRSDNVHIFTYAPGGHDLCPRVPCHVRTPQGAMSCTYTPGSHVMTEILVLH